MSGYIFLRRSLRSINYQKDAAIEIAEKRRELKQNKAAFGVTILMIQFLTKALLFLK